MRYYRTFGGPITSTGEVGIRMEIWQDDTNHVFDKYNNPYIFTKKKIGEPSGDISFQREYKLVYMGERITAQTPAKDILTELEDVP